MEYLNKIIQGDCVETLKQMPDASIDLIFADPPYNLQLEDDLIRYEGTKFDGVDDEWDKFPTLEAYADFCTQWISECKRVLKRNGSLWIIGSFQNIYKIGSILQDMGFWIINDIVWSKLNPVPNFSGTRFTNAHETLLWVVKDKKSKPTFNYKTMKDFNGGKQMKSVWEIPLCTGNERLKDENGHKIHSTQKPEEILKRIILSTSKEGDVILDPFFGTGTTGAVAKKYNRNYVGIEMNMTYCKIAQERIDKVIPENMENLRKLEEKPARVTFQNLLEKNIISKNEMLYSPDGKIIATWCEDSYVDLNGEHLSIHISAARCLNRTNYNGWTYWYISRNGQRILIDKLREEYRNKFCHE